MREFFLILDEYGVLSLLTSAIFLERLVLAKSCPLNPPGRTSVCGRFPARRPANGHLQATTGASPSKWVVPGKLADGQEMNRLGHCGPMQSEK